jgi:hypothetical protein
VKEAVFAVKNHKDKEHSHESLMVRWILLLSFVLAILCHSLFFINRFMEMETAVVVLWRA